MLGVGQRARAPDPAEGRRRRRDLPGFLSGAVNRYLKGCTPPDRCTVFCSMPRRARQFLLVASILWLSWLAMMLVHEGGHVLGALCTGGTVRRVVWHPLVLSRTDVRPKPHPLLEVWAGPVFGSLLPLAIAAAASIFRARFAYLTWVVAGFCLIANGAYIGIGAIDPIGDARELIARGTPRWPMAAFGLLTVTGGLWAWHRASPRLGFGAAPEAVNARHAYLMLVVAVLVTLAGIAFEDKGM